MKKAMIVLVGLLIFISAAVSQTSLKRAFEEENSEEFRQLFDKNVDMFVLNKERRATTAEAVATMEAFFQTHAVQSFKMMHSGESRGQSSNYEIHELATDKGKYRVYVYYKADGSKKLISELRIENN